MRGILGTADAYDVRPPCSAIVPPPDASADGRCVPGWLFSAKRICAAFLACAIFACVAAGCASAAPAPTASGLISAMNGESLSELPASDWDTQMAAMSAQGVQVVRSDASWTTIEPTFPNASGDRWSFTVTDQWVAALASNHLRWQPILDYNNWWATAVGDNAAFANYGAEVASRYGPGGAFWNENPQLPYLPVQTFEVWNEENGQPWYISPTDYGPLYTATHDAIHAVDPTASVDIGGLADDSGDFVPNDDYPSWYVIRLLNIYPAMRGQIDGFALHPYGTTATDVIDWVNEFRTTLDGLGESGVPIDITEVGWVTGSSSEEQWRTEQMAQLGQAFTHSSDDLRELAPYDWVNSTSVGDQGDFGFVDETGTDTTLRPAAVSWFRTLDAAGVGSTPTSSTSPPSKPPTSSSSTPSARAASTPIPARFVISLKPSGKDRRASGKRASARRRSKRRRVAQRRSSHR
jgi:hypothetical protein